MAGGVASIDMAQVVSIYKASIWLPSILFGVGLLMALVPVVAQLNGSGRQVRFHLRSSKVRFSARHSLPIIGVLFQTQLIKYLNGWTLNNPWQKTIG